MSMSKTVAQILVECGVVTWTLILLMVNYKV